MTVTDEQVMRDRLDLEMLERPHLWPQEHLGRRCVFVKRRIAQAGVGETGPCFEAADGGSGRVVMAHDWASDKATPLQYDSAEAVYDDDWRVD